MITYQELIAEHQALQKQLDEHPDSVETGRVLRLIGQTREAGAYIGNSQQREQLRAILRHWGAFVYQRTGEYPATQLVPYEQRIGLGGRILTPGVRVALCLVAVIIIGTVAVVWGDPLLQMVTSIRMPTATPTVSTETLTPPPTATPQPIVYLEPLQVTVAVGETATVNIRVDNAQHLSGVFLKLKFDPNYIQVQDADPNQPETQVTPGASSLKVERNQVIEDGTIIYEATNLETGFQDGDIVASIELRLTEPGGSATLNIESAAAMDPEGNPVEVTLLPDRQVTTVTAAATPMPISTPTPTPTPRATPGLTLTVTPLVYPTPTLIGIDVIGCTVTLKWDWAWALAEDMWFAVRVAKAPDVPHSVFWAKESAYSFSPEEAGEYTWEVAICQGDPSAAHCSKTDGSELAASERGNFLFGGCTRKPTPPSPW